MHLVHVLINPPPTHWLPCVPSLVLPNIVWTIGISDTFSPLTGGLPACVHHMFTMYSDYTTEFDCSDYNNTFDDYDANDYAYRCTRSRAYNSMLCGHQIATLNEMLDIPSIA